MILMVLQDPHHGIMTIPHLGTLHHLHLLMMTLIYLPLPLPTLLMDHLEEEGEVEMGEVAAVVEVQLVEGVKLQPEEQ